MRAVFLDKDGTLVRDLPFNVDPDRIELAAHAGAALRMLAGAGYTLFVVSNQSGVALGKFEEGALEAVRDRLIHLLAREGVALRDFYYCPHHPNGEVPYYARACACRKPGEGMLLRAAHTYGIELSESWMVGDILDDIEAGHRAGCQSVLIDNGNETEWIMSPLRRPDFTATDLIDAARAILRRASVPA